MRRHPQSVRGLKSLNGADEGDRILEVQHLGVTFQARQGLVHAVNDVSFSLRRGQTLAIVGESGSGKSVTALSLMRLLHEPPAHVSGRVVYRGMDIRTLAEADMRRIRGRQIGMIFQDPMSALNPVRTIAAQMTETLTEHLGLSRRMARQRAVEFLGMVGIPSPERLIDSHPHELSGGMCQRVMIAMALSCEPWVLLADEPTTALDVSVQAQILELLRNVTDELKTALLLISHDLSVVAGLADRVGVMYGGELVELGASETVFAKPLHPYSVGLLQCIPRVDEHRGGALPSIMGSPPILSAEPEGCPFAPRCPLVMNRCRVERPALEERASDQLVACWADVPAELGRAVEAFQATTTDASQHAGRLDSGATRGALLEVRDLAVHFRLGDGGPFRQGSVVRGVDGVTFTILPGETLGLVGESGSGKSTTARAILQLEKATRGAVVFEGRTLTGLGEADVRAVRPRMQLVFQNPYSSLNPRLSVGALVGEPLVLNGAGSRRQIRERVNHLLDLVGLGDGVVGRYPRELSGGQRQRVGMARALALDPSLVVADEPTSALDVSVRAQILNLMQDLQAEKRLTYLFISHDLSIVHHMSTHVAVMYLGKIVELAERDSLYGHPQHPYTQALLSAVPIPDPQIERRRQAAIIGEIPSPLDPPSGCPYHTRCPLAFDRCRTQEPPLVDQGGGHQAACFLAEPGHPAPDAVGSRAGRAATKHAG